MMHRKTALMLIIPILVLAVPLLAADEPAPTDAPPETADRASVDQPVSLINLPPERVARLAPLQAQLRLILLDERTRLAPLEEAFAKETDSLRGFEIQRQIRDVKIGTEIALMRTQAEHARLNGRPEVAERIEEGLRRMAERGTSRQEAAQDRSVRPSRPDAQR